MTDFTYDLDADGVATITWDVPGKSMNVMSIEGLSSSPRARTASRAAWTSTSSRG